MKKKLIHIGNGWSIYIPSHILKLMGINPKESNVIFDVAEDVLEVRKADPNDPDLNALMLRKFIRSGHGFALYIPNTILQLLAVEPEKDVVSLVMNKQKLIIKKG